MAVSNTKDDGRSSDIDSVRSVGATVLRDKMTFVERRRHDKGGRIAVFKRGQHGCIAAIDKQDYCRMEALDLTVFLCYIPKAHSLEPISAVTTLHQHRNLRAVRTEHNRALFRDSGGDFSIDHVLGLG